MLETLDKGITLSPKRGRRAGPLAEVEGAFCLRLVATALIICLMFPLSANAYPLNRQQQDWALIAMNHLVDLEETQCWVELIWRESTFNPLAVNGSHKGLGQMRSEWYGKLNPRKQVKAHLKYLDHRYSNRDGKGSACLALKHLNRRGWH
jgi:hypothetical protein